MALVRRKCAAALELVNRKAPTAFRIWRAGENRTDYGMSLFTARSQRSVMADFARRGKRLSIDVEHASLVPIELRLNDQVGAAVGWFEPAVRNGELWAVNVEWLPEGKRQVESRERPYFSPAYDQDKKTGEIAVLVNMAICVNAATHGLAMLASRDNRNNRRAVMDPNLQKLIDLLNAIVNATDLGEAQTAAKAALEALQAEETSEEEAAAAAKVAEDAAKVTARGKSSAEIALAAEVARQARRLDGIEVRGIIAANRHAFPNAALESWALAKTPTEIEEYIRATGLKPAVKVAQSRERQDNGKDAGAADKDYGLSEAEIKRCKASGIKPEVYAASKAKAAATRGKR